MTQTMATTSSWSEQGAEKRLLSSLDRIESPCRASISSSSFLEMPKPRVEEHPEAVPPGYCPAIPDCLMFDGLMVMEQSRLHPADSHKWLRSPLSIISHGRGQRLLDVSACWASGVPKPICQFLTTISTLIWLFRLPCSVTPHLRLSMSFLKIHCVAANAMK